MIPMKDSRNRESTTLTFVTISWLAIVLKFLASWILPNRPDMSATEFGAAVAAVLAIWLGREWTEKVRRVRDETSAD